MLKRKYNTEFQQYIKSLVDNWDETINKYFNYLENVR